MANFQIETDNSFNKAKIKVIGTGGAGGNAVNTMINKGLQEVEFIAVNTDFQDLSKSLAPTKLQIGEGISKGLGSGGNPQVAKEAAIQNRDKISDAIGEADMVFITAGMGGGTGTGISPVIAEVCKEKNILTVATVTRPFEFEGKMRIENANYGVEELDKHVDTLIVIPNEKLSALHKKISILEAFQERGRSSLPGRQRNFRYRYGNRVYKRRLCRCKKHNGKSRRQGSYEFRVRSGS